ncbi:MAG: hypothetical protein LDL31_12105, partial [Prosthecobacter sp.]|nr:hypothetical protein [Prosthecobacter sp.]
MHNRLLVIYGSFGLQKLGKTIPDWSLVDVVEMDSLLPEHSAASKAIDLPASCHQRAARINTGTRHLLDLFLTDRVPTPPDLELSRDFRAACLSIDAWRILSPYLLNLEIARTLAANARWSQILVSPGAGVSPLAWQQLAEHLSIPITLLPLDSGQPPMLWKLSRKWQAWQVKRAQPAKLASPALPPLPVANAQSEQVNADPRLTGLLSGSTWHQLPSLTMPTEETQAQLRSRYLAWWQTWWASLRAEKVHTPPLEDDTRILDALGRYACSQVYPRFAPMLTQARNALSCLSPKALLCGAMRGKKELFYALAARERSISTGLVTLDDALDPKLAAKMDHAFCDDLRHAELAQARGINPARIKLIRSQRLPRPSLRPSLAITPGKRARIIMADTFFIGAWLASMPWAGLWAARLVVETARQMPEHDFLIKLHPIRERPEEIFAWTGFHHRHLHQRHQWFRSLRPPPNVTLLAPEHRLSNLLQDANLLLNLESYASYEAFALGLPVI